MKKAKVMLMALAVIGIAGGALAFKAKTNNFGNTITVYSICGSTDVCSDGAVSEPDFTTSVNTIPGSIVVNATTDNSKTCSSNTDCQASLTLYVKS